MLVFGRRWIRVQRALVQIVSMNDAFFCSDDLGDFCPVRVHEPRVQQCSTFS